MYSQGSACGLCLDCASAIHHLLESQWKPRCLVQSNSKYNRFLLPLQLSTPLSVRLRRRTDARQCLVYHFITACTDNHPLRGPRPTAFKSSFSRTNGVYSGRYYSPIIRSTHSRLMVDIISLREDSSLRRSMAPRAYSAHRLQEHDAG